MINIIVGSAGAVLMLSLVTSTSTGPQAAQEAPQRPVMVRTVVETAAVLTATVEAPEVVVRQPIAVVVTAPLVIGSSQPIPISLGEFYEALARSEWPEVLWDRVVAIAHCESTHNLNAEGDGGRAIGVLQIRVDAHRSKSLRYDLRALDDALGAAWAVYTEAGYSFRPWSCA